MGLSFVCGGKVFEGDLAGRAHGAPRVLLRFRLSRSREIHLGLCRVHIAHDPFHGVSLFQIWGGSRGLKTKLIQQFEHRRVGHFTVNHQFLVAIFGQGSMDQRFDGGHAFSAGTFRDVGQTQGHAIGVGGASVGVQHDGRPGVLPTGGQIAPPSRKDREPFRWRDGNLFYLGCGILVF